MNRLTSNDGDIHSASEGTLIYFASYLARTVKHSTIKLYLSAVRNLDISCGHGDPVQQKVLRGFLLPAIQPILHTWLGERDLTMIWAASP